MLPGRELPNDDPDNTCFGCGPNNPRGLRMRFFDDGEVVRSALTLSDDYSGWPGNVISDVVSCVMDETLCWTSWARFGQLATEDGPRDVQRPGGLRTGQPFTVEGRVARVDGAGMTLEARVLQGGAAVATMRVAYRPLTAQDAARTLQRAGLPRSIREELEQILAGTRPAGHRA